MFNPGVYGRSSVPGLGVLGMSGFNLDELISGGKAKLDELTGENLQVPSKEELEELMKQPSEGIAQEIGQELEQAGKATGTAMVETAWTKVKPFAIGALAILGGILIITLVKTRKRK